MDKCSCYMTKKILCHTPFYTHTHYKMVGVCNGTKEQEECSCGGDKSKCDFYSYVREEAKVNMSSVSLIDGHIDEPKMITTNGDYVRAMNDTELAHFMMTAWFVDGVCKHCEGEYDMCGDLKFCESKVLEWLQKEKE